jgi:hypothetical protein
MFAADTSVVPSCECCVQTRRYAGTYKARATKAMIGWLVLTHAHTGLAADTLVGPGLLCPCGAMPTLCAHIAGTQTLTRGAGRPAAP